MSKQLAKIEAITKKLKARYVSRMHYFYILVQSSISAIVPGLRTTLLEAHHAR